MTGCAFGPGAEPTDPWEHPAMKRFTEQVRSDLLPKLHDSILSIGLIAGEPDVKQAVEIGFSLLLGKPLVLAVTPGVKVPDGLVRAADEIVEFDPDNPQGLIDALDRVAELIKEERE